MRIVLFTHSLVSCWNHGNAHFLRGVVRELLARGHEVRALEPRNGWSRWNMRADGGDAAEAAFRTAFPGLASDLYDPTGIDLDHALDDADAVIVHEWTDPALVAAIGRVRARGGRFLLLFHDTHHRMVTKPEEMAALDLSSYDGVLAFGAVLRERYAAAGWGRRAWTWHEAADTALFRPLPEVAHDGDLVWIGNWGDDERTAELHEFLLEPVRRLRLKALIHGVRYPDHALRALEEAGIRYGGWLPNHSAPEVFARHCVTVHVPRRPYVEALPGIPTIRVFEALACGIPLVSAPWEDAEGLFRPGTDFLTASDGHAMERQLRGLLNDPAMAAELAGHGRAAVLARHTCAHRVDELLTILAGLGATETAITPATASATGEIAR